MNGIILVSLITMMCALFTMVFVRDLKRGVVRTGFGVFDEIQMPRRFKLFRALNLVLFSIGYALVILLWVFTIRGDLR